MYVFPTEEFFEVTIGSCLEWDLNFVSRHVCL